MATWIPESQRDTRWYIWNKLFRCRVPNIQTMSVEYIQQYGMPVSGDPRHDKETADELVMRMLSINQMVEMYKNGVTVSVCRAEDTKEIYDHIVKHLTAWKDRLEYSLNVRGAPLDDLVLLDTFASAVYKHARHHFDRSYVESYLSRLAGGSLRVTRDRIMKPFEPGVRVINARQEVPGEPAAEPAAPKLPEHESMSDVFLGKKRIFSGGSRWK